MVSRAGIESRLKKIEARLAPARQIFVLPTCDQCGLGLDPAAEAAAQAQSREGDLHLRTMQYGGCPHCAAT